ncbi:hypothetical protein [Streptomyces sp. D54]|uniref:hypothetical protein n=1 Tax=Streptomyces sp. D54 TaxID=1290289 RepID=UPI003CEF62AF
MPDRDPDGGGPLAATWAAVLDDIDAVTASVRASLEADIKHTQRKFLESVQPGEVDTDPAGAASVLAFAALQTVEAALSDYRSNALERLGRTEEAEAEARRAYKTEQGRRWFRHNPNGADAIAAATKAADTARERAANAAEAAARADRRPDRTGPGRAVDGPAARTRCPPAAHRHGRGGDRMTTEPELSGVDLARQALLAARETARKSGATRQKPKAAHHHRRTP